MTVCSRPEDGLRCRQGVTPPLNQTQTQTEITGGGDYTHHDPCLHGVPLGGARFDLRHLMKRDNFCLTEFNFAYEICLQKSSLSIKLFSAEININLVKYIFPGWKDHFCRQNMFRRRQQSIPWTTNITFVDEMLFV